MSPFRGLYPFVFSYRSLAVLTLIGNLLFTVFNMVSLVMFVPFLQLIFNSEDLSVALPKPNFSGSLLDFPSYLSDYYNYFMHKLVSEDVEFALAVVCFLVFKSFLLKNLFRYMAVWFQSELRTRVARDIRNAFYKKIIRLPLSFHYKSKKGDLLSRFSSDAHEVENAVVSLLELIFRDPVSIALHVTTLFLISYKLTLFSLFLLPISAFVISKVGKSLKKTAKSSQEKLGLLSSSFDESLTGIRVIKSFNALGFMTDVFHRLNATYQYYNSWTMRKKDVSSILNEIIGAGVLMSLVWFGGKQILSGGGIELTGELFITFVIVFSQLLRPIQDISRAIASIQKGRVSLDRINEIMKQEEVILNKSTCVNLPSFKNSLRFNNVSFRYENEDVLNNVSFELKKGQKIAIVGESGSGKSTILDLIQRFYDPTKGHIDIDNSKLTDCSIKSVRSICGVVSQESMLFNVSVIENIAFGDDNIDYDRAVLAAKNANAHGFISGLPDGYNSIVSERGNNFSGGQKQRLCIARAIYRNPDLLILDEATSALDTESEKHVQEALEKIMIDRTVIIVAHRLSTIRNVDEILVLNKGQIVEQGSHSGLFNKKGYYRRLCELQGIID
jgi:subfamily B ATP-binding cassette protein MsbA